ncbi:tRNA uridine-5-carboxymethylaminomethyl(34) synthesis GTPase MnmE [Candidatus Pantoea edessiphila]|uniref:tRNA modification GTPase MnmE n=1 Tax=Candidatus Pantoea edessiphila TaxID=2044610 RepID=A0A2P5SZC9_9GAMM|nr:tRNA uridine-5-carboxymethylaminomethyl(34) synthesis GTPase MnmE [Candidatus Pantoea edessiphila]PPI87660.1 tRNA uridine-5-carboxymethylaminomethyl(34) synthesis GTPase MnmE [Candidatus Pantoea edessiphila]
MNQYDTIVAQATPIGTGSIGILRISGVKTVKIAKKILGKLPKPRYAEYLSFKDYEGKTLDKGIALWFPKPHSFTGEDVLELHCHGGPIILDLLLKYIITFSQVRIAKPGEFSERAFLNEKIDLTQAEAIVDLINASSEQSVRSAVNSLQGTFSKHINKIIKDIINLRVYIEAKIDFPDEEIEYISNNNILNQLNSIITDLDQLISEAHQGCLLREGIKIVIAGYPNAGKSSLFNYLSKKENAIVTSIAGTTRDVLHENVNIDGMPLHILDTAGLRNSNDEIEYIGIKKALYEIEQADHVLFMVDGSNTDSKQSVKILSDCLSTLTKKISVTIIRNKADVTGEPLGLIKINGFSIIHLSVLNNIGMNTLFEHLKTTVGFKYNTEGNFIARRRHLQALQIAHDHLIKSNKKLSKNCTDELIAEDLRFSQMELNKITGNFTSNNILNEIFSSFCIGK